MPAHRFSRFFSAQAMPGLASDRNWSWLPGQCAICMVWPARPVCDTCISAFAQPVHRCALCALKIPQGIYRCGDCLRSPPPWQLGLTAVSYEWPWVNLIAQFKYQAQPGWSGTLASLMHSAPGVEDALAQAQCVIPMPLSLERLAQRGFNQSLLLAKNMSPQHTRFDILLRLRDTPTQQSLPRSERLNNLQDAFAVNPLQAASLRNQHVVLVDDVMTTGASLQMAAKALQSAGVAHLTTVVFARTENKELDQA